MSKWWLFMLVVLAPDAAFAADPPKPGSLVRTIQFDPHAKAARLAAQALSRMKAPGWMVLAQLVRSYEPTDVVAARALARALVGGRESTRLRMIANVFEGAKDPELRAIAAGGLTSGYPKYADVVHKHLMEGGPQSDEILRSIIARGLTEEAAAELLASPTVGEQIYDHLRQHDVLPFVNQLVPLARTLSRRGLAPAACADVARKFATNVDLRLLHAFAEVLRDNDPDVKRGAHYILLTLSGKRLLAEADIWRSWVDGRSMYVPPAPLSQGVVQAAVLRAAHFLAHDLLPDGKAVWKSGQSEIGATALAVVALRAAGVPPSHPAVEKALQQTLLVHGRGNRPGVPALGAKREVYDLSLLAMALGSVDGKRYTDPLISIRDRLVQGQASNGQWTYSAARGTSNLPPLRGDNSNTQYALLALRAIRRAGIPVPKETWEKAAGYWRGNAHELGGWHYRPERRFHGKRRVSMTSAGIGSMAICLEGLEGDKAASSIERNSVIARALQYLGELLLLQGIAGNELYAMYGIERAGMLTGVAEFRSKFRHADWYRDGATHLLAVQRDDGSWGNPRAKSDVQGSGYGLVVDTAYAILFLQRATATIGKMPARVIHVAIENEKPPAPPKDATEKVTPPTRTPDPMPEAPSLIALDAIEVYTNTGIATIGGRVLQDGIAVQVGGTDTPLDEHGRFAADLLIGRTQEIAVVALHGGKEAERHMVKAVLDVHPPEIELIGGVVRAVGTQTVRVRANETLAGVRSGNRFVPADNNIVDVPVDLAPGRPTVLLTAVDRAGNETKQRFAFEVTNRVLVLDGKSAVRVDLKEKPPVFTVECWFRSDLEPTHGESLVADTEGAGFGLFWRSGGSKLPSGYVRVAGGDYLICKLARRPRLKRWHHMALTYDGKAARLFLDGKLKAELAGATYVPSSRAVFIGAEPRRNNTPNEFLEGAIDEVRISRVVRYHANFKPAKYLGRDIHTVLLMHFDTDSATAFFDDSPYGHTGRPAGAPRVEEMKR